MYPVLRRQPQLRTFHRELGSSYPLRIDISILNQNEEVLGRLTTKVDNDVEDGQVDYDRKADVTRSAQIRVLDERGDLRLEGASPSVRGLYVDRFLRIERHHYSVGLEKWVETPLFTGPIKSFYRSGPEVDISALGKQALYMEPSLNWRPLRIRKGAQIDEAIRDLLGHYGEKNFRFPAGLKKRLHKNLGVPRHGDIWAKAERLAQALNYDLDFDGMGFAVLRRPQRNPVFTFRMTGDRAVLKTWPEQSYDFDNVVNVVEVVGRKPKKGKKKDEGKRKTPKRPRYVAMPPRNHPLSPWSLARNGEPRFFVHRIENDKLRTKQECKELAERVLRQRLSIHLDTTFTSMVVPHLEPGDSVLVEVEPDRMVEYLFNTGSIPLPPGAEMTFGSYRYMKQRKRRGRR